jgi:alkanesulfonate monooxygenase SsuD/methylene tetrahydromethanopterin reductase-like flavin-dependent oxidoreductase (luciferase family)
MEFHLIQAGTVGRRKELELGMAGQRDVLYQRYLEEVKAYVHAADELGYTGYGHNEHHLQIEGFEETNHPGMTSLFIGLNSKRIKANTLGYVLPTHNPVRVAEEIATLDHILQGRLNVGFTRGYQARWFQNYAAVPGAHATTPDLAKRRDEQDRINREIFEESVRIIKTAWTNDVFSYEGKYWTFPPNDLVQKHSAYVKFGKGVGEDGRITRIGIAPRPYQKPHPKIYGAFAHSMRTVRFWAREGGKPIVLANNLDFCEGLWQAYQEEADKAGRSVAHEDVAAWGGILSIDRSRERALAKLEEHWWIWDQWFLPFDQARPMAIVGTPDEVSQQIETAYNRLRFNEVHLQIGQGYLEKNEVIDELELFASKVMPRFNRH